MEKLTNEQIVDLLKKHFTPGNCSSCMLCHVKDCTIELAEQVERAITDLETRYANMRDNFESLQKEHARYTEEYNRKLTAARDRIRNLTDVNAELTAKCERLEGLKQPKSRVSAQIHKAINAFTMEHCGCKRPSKVIINRSCFEALEAEIKPFVRDWEAVKTVKLFEGIPVEVVESDKNEKPRFSLSYDYRTFDVE